MAPNGTGRTVLTAGASALVAAVIGAFVTYVATGQQNLAATVRANERVSASNAIVIDQMRRDRDAFNTTVTTSLNQMRTEFTASVTQMRTEFTASVKELTEVVTQLRISVSSLQGVIRSQGRSP